jgi:hypothetical protein
MIRPRLATSCGSFTHSDFKKHIAECIPCWDHAQQRTDLSFDPLTIRDPRLKDKQETVCIACNQTNFLEPDDDLKTQPCSDCHRIGSLMPIADYLELSINQIEGLKKQHRKPRLKRDRQTPS